MIAVRDHLDQFADAKIAVVTFAAPDRLAAYRTQLRLPFDVVADTDRTLYRLLGPSEAPTARCGLQARSGCMRD